MWSGLLAAIPEGWLLCDGNNGTPDLREKFIKGCADATDPGDTGGAELHTPDGTLNSVSAGTPAGSVGLSLSTATDTAVTGAGTRVTGGSASFSGSALAGHTHTFTGTEADYQPAFFTLAFLMKQ